MIKMIERIAFSRYTWMLLEAIGLVSLVWFWTTDQLWYVVALLWLIGQSFLFQLRIERAEDGRNYRRLMGRIDNE